MNRGPGLTDSSTSAQEFIVLFEERGFLSAITDETSIRVNWKFADGPEYG